MTEETPAVEVSQEPTLPEPAPVVVKKAKKPSTGPTLASLDKRIKALEETPRSETWDYEGPEVPDDVLSDAVEVNAVLDALKAEGYTLADVLRHVAHTAFGVRV